MDKRGIRELNKVFSKTSPRIDKLRTFYIDSDKNIISELNEWIQSLDEQEMFKYLEILKATLTGKFGTNLFNVTYSPKDGVNDNNPQYSMLLDLRHENLFSNEDVVKPFVESIVRNYECAGRYLIVLGHGVYDIPRKTTDNMKLDESEDVYRFFITAICPVELAKEGLCYNQDSDGFEIFMKDWSVKNPETGFLFPAFNDRQEDVFGALFFTKSSDCVHQEFVEAIMGTHLGKTNTEYKSIYNSLIEESLDMHCDYNSVNAIRDALTENVKLAENRMESYKLNKASILTAMDSADISEEAKEKFSELYDKAMEEDELKEIPSDAVINTSKVEVESDDFKLTIDQESSDMFRTQVIDGREYLLLPITNNFKLNGITLRQSMSNN